MESLAATPVGRLEEVKQCRKNITYKKKNQTSHFISLNRGIIFMPENTSIYLFFQISWLPIVHIKRKYRIERIRFPNLRLHIIIFSYSDFGHTQIG